MKIRTGVAILVAVCFAPSVVAADDNLVPVAVDAGRTAPAPTVWTAPPDARCPQWHQLAIDAGWQPTEMMRLDHIMWRESRCEPMAHNRADPQTGSRGLVQINGFWCRTNRWEVNPAGFLGALGVLEHCNDLYDPAVNLEAARWIYTYQVFNSRCGWLPWTTRQTRWC